MWVRVVSKGYKYRDSSRRGEDGINKVLGNDKGPESTMDDDPHEAQTHEGGEATSWVDLMN